MNWVCARPGHEVRPLTAQTRVRIPAGSCGKKAGSVEEISADSAFVVAGEKFRTTGGPKLSAVVRLLTVRDVAERLAVCTATVYALCERGELRHLRVSNAIRILLGDLEAFIAGKRG
jgi:excisionase family DNA binding protein